MNDVIREFMNLHGIPEDRPILEGLSDKQILFENELLGRQIGGNSLPHEIQDRIAGSAARVWNRYADREGLNVLDIGCGQGYFTYHMNGNGHYTCGLNRSVVESELASRGIPDPETRKMVWHEKKSMDVVVGSALHLPYKTGSFDGINCSGVLMMLPFSEKLFGNCDSAIDICRDAIGEMHRVLRPDGRLDILTFSTGFPPNKEKTENYIHFSKHCYIVYDGNGEIIDTGDVGIEHIFRDAGFRDVNAYPVNDRFWKCYAYK